MKSVMQKSSEDHKKFVDALEETKLQKEVETCLCETSAITTD